MKIWDDFDILKQKVHQGVNDDQKVYAFVFTFRVNSHLFPDGQFEYAFVGDVGITGHE